MLIRNTKFRYQREHQGQVLHSGALQNNAARHRQGLCEVSRPHHWQEPHLTSDCREGSKVLLFISRLITLHQPCHDQVVHPLGLFLM